MPVSRCSTWARTHRRSRSRRPLAQPAGSWPSASRRRCRDATPPFGPSFALSGTLASRRRYSSAVRPSPATTTPGASAPTAGQGPTAAARSPLWSAPCAAAPTTSADVGATIVLFNRDLRLTDNSALTAAAAGSVVPLFVLDDALLRRGAPNRVRFMLNSLEDLRHSLRSLGADLVVRAGDTVTETVATVRAVGATAVAASADVSAFAQRRQSALADACADAGATFELHPGVTVVPPGELRPTGGGGHFRVFTPYWRKWSTATWRDVRAAPSRLALPSGVDVGRLPSFATLVSGTCSPDVVT
ncbi:MAG: deoxyribodipyrimidine photo-lyase, partial [Candidatus Rokuibacteriota bacterium]